VTTNLDWDRWSAAKHLVSILCDEVATLAACPSLQVARAHAKTLLSGATSNLGRVAAGGLHLRDGADAYQAAWLSAIVELEQEAGSDLAYLARVT
jgi:hypothetical protein